LYGLWLVATNRLDTSRRHACANSGRHSAKEICGWLGGKEEKVSPQRQDRAPRLSEIRWSPGTGEQSIDKERDLYQHTIVDEEGIVLHDETDETHRLSEHQGRGSAKFKRP
jgi:hypothetical protein